MIEIDCSIINKQRAPILSELIVRIPSIHTEFDKFVVDAITPNQIPKCFFSALGLINVRQVIIDVLINNIFDLAQRLFIELAFTAIRKLFKKVSINKNVWGYKTLRVQQLIGVGERLVAPTYILNVFEFVVLRNLHVQGIKIARNNLCKILKLMLSGIIVFCDPARDRLIDRCRVTIVIGGSG